MESYTAKFDLLFLILLKSLLDQLEHDLLEVNSNKDALTKNFLELIELKHILMKATNFFYEVSLTLFDFNRWVLF